jgi:hypothetical protein
MEPCPRTLNEALDRLRNASRSHEQHSRDLADAIEILVLLCIGGLDSRDLDADITNFRPASPSNTKEN